MGRSSLEDWGAWALRPSLRYHLLALTFFVVVFGLVPFSIYAHSGEDWPFPFHHVLWLSTLGLVLFAGAALILRVVAALHSRAATAIACGLFCLGTFLLLAHVYAPSQIGPLDGSEMQVEEPVLYAAIELGLFVALIFLWLQLHRGRGLSIAAAFSLALLLVGTGYAGVLTWLDRKDVPRAQAATEGAADIRGNVYHIVLDSLRTDIFLSALEGSSRTQDFDGFELFAHNISNYVSTIPSSASYFTGTLWKSGEFKHWVQQWRRDKGIFPAVSDRGHRVWMYAPFPHWDTRHVDRFWYNMDIYELDSGFHAHTGFYDLIQIWLLGLVPTPLTSELAPAAADLRDQIFARLTGQREPSSVTELHPKAGEAMLRRLRREEALRPAHGQYVYAHAALPHAPFVFDPDCRLVEPGTKKRKGYLEQTQCALGRVAEFLAELKWRGRFDDATIILHADTGQGLARVRNGDRLGGPTTLGTANESLLRVVDALLMIKRPHADGPLKRVSTPTQLIDVFPTIVDLLGLEPGYETDGKSVYALRPDEPRDALIAFDPNRKYGHEFVAVRVEDQTDLKTSKLTVIGPAFDAATWHVRPRQHEPPRTRNARALRH